MFDCKRRNTEDKIEGEGKYEGELFKHGKVVRNQHVGEIWQHTEVQICWGTSLTSIFVKALLKKLYEKDAWKKIWIYRYINRIPGYWQVSQGTG